MATALRVGKAWKHLRLNVPSRSSPAGSIISTHGTVVAAILPTVFPQEAAQGQSAYSSETLRKCSIFTELDSELASDGRCKVTRRRSHAQVKYL
jgi:hypothetical protein